ncbi:hypothetical protein V6N13_135950 [Hibiscus sabdariffa]
MFDAFSQTVYSCRIVSMSRPFSVTTDSTCEFSQPTSRKCKCLALVRHCRPCNFGSSLCLFSYLIKFIVTGVVIEHLGVQWLQSMERPLSMCPF